MSEFSENKYIIKISDGFIIATNEILDLLSEYPNRADSVDRFAIILLEIYQCVILDALKSCQFLVTQRKFFSLAIICRSLFDIIIQLRWILSLKTEEKQRAIDHFFEFEGVGKGKNKKPYHEWYHEISPQKIRKKAIDLGIDREIVSLPLKSDGETLELTTFDYLSKIIHWNPRMLKELGSVDIYLNQSIMAAI